MSRPLISVVIPARNAEAWIRDTLASVAAQTYPKEYLEVLVVDDGSVDHTAEAARDVLRESAVTYRILESAEPGGVSAARNAGWVAARGEWIQFLDSDDLIEPEKLERQSARASGADARVAVIFSTWGRLGRPQDDCVTPSLQPDPVAALLDDRNVIATGSQLVRRSWLPAVGGFDERLRLIEDVDLHLRLAMAGARFECAPANAPLFWYRFRHGSASRANRLDFARACVRNAGMVEAHWRHADALTTERVRVLVRVYGQQLRCLAEECPQEFDELLARVYELDPAFRPDGSKALTMLSVALGYRRAEALSIAYRRLKRLSAKVVAR